MKYNKCFKFLKASVKNFFKISSLLKIFLLYCATIIWVIVLYADFSPSLIKNTFLRNSKPNYIIAVYSVQNRIGESLLYNRLLKAADNIGIGYVGINFEESLSNFWLIKHFYTVAANVLNIIFKPKFNLSLTHYVKIVPIGYNIAYLNVPRNMLYDFYEKFSSELIHLSKYDAYIDLYSIMNLENKVLNHAIESTSITEKPIIPLYFAHNQAPYSPPQRMHEVVITGTLWGCNRNSMRVIKGLKALGDDGLLVAYGIKKYLDFLDEAYISSVEDFKSNLINNDSVDQKLLLLQKKHGVVLVLHSFEHAAEGIPTSRISEAAAAGALIISDRNPFIVKYFKDSVLYFDIFASEIEIYNEIKNHILWARNNKSAAIEKGKQAYEIFNKHFTIETQLKKLITIIDSQ